jgi:hypothetical protein
MHITHWDLAFSLPEGLVAYFACLAPPTKVSTLSFESRVLFTEEFSSTYQEFHCKILESYYHQLYIFY